MTDIGNLKVYACVLCTCSSDGKPVRGTEHEVMVMYNQTQISEEEVTELFEHDTWEYDSRVTPITREQLKMLQDKNEV